MSRSHIRVQSPAPPRRNLKLGILSGIMVLLIGMSTALYVLSRPPFDSEHDTAPGKVLESRIDAVQIVNGGHGGFARYQIQAHVEYRLRGQLQDHWMPASEIDRSREFLQLRLNAHPQACQVYWVPAHPENPRCRFE